ncbi:lipase family protein [Meridianimarinicoccus aquatilis]|uniref:Lipase family protein n=1 Tax=Meridianimarinicoccus aquatilis TaxID=2552766 RepID=A0A4R6APT0_9RHOB|nr:lipase family protein [Fluviibacterium aquatile]TDL86080.1 lipase family protein [Fluviibacterium aquatile]
MEISPGLAATLADAVYGVREQGNVRRAVARQIGSPEVLEDVFDVSGAAVAGMSGGRLLGAKSGFGMVLRGRGPLEGHMAVVTRGTETQQDWLSNANVAYDTGPGGFPVHAGFSRLYASMKDDVNASMRGKDPSHIHIVGHSLGGAVANLFAAQFKLENRGDVHLYTFGAPRPGHGAFSRFMTSELDATHHRRVYCGADPVPMVPTWPFMHAPIDMPGLRSPHGGSLMSIEAHRIPSYRNALYGYTWREMQAAQGETSFNDTFEYWIGKAQSPSFGMMSSGLIWALGRALRALFRALSVGLVLVGIPTLTAIDRLAGLMFGAAQRSSETEQNLMQVVAGFGRFLGYAAIDGINLSAALLSHIFTSVYQVLARLARGALNAPA